MEYIRFWFSFEKQSFESFYLLNFFNEVLKKLRSFDKLVIKKSNFHGRNLFPEYVKNIN